MSAVGELLRPFEGRTISPGQKVLLKPNLVEPVPYTSGQTTNPALVGAMIQWCRAQGAKEVVVGEGPSYFQSEDDLVECFTLTGMAEAAEENGARWLLFDEYRFTPLPAPLNIFSVSTFAFSFDRIINLPVPKTHYLTGVSIAMKNLKGFLKRDDKPRFHHSGYGIHRNIVELNRIIRPALSVVDVTAPVHKNAGFILAGEDIVAADAVTSSLMGFNPGEIKTIVLGHQAGLGEMDLQKIEVIGEDVKGLKMNFELPQEWLKRSFPRLRLVGIEDACSGCMLSVFNTFSRLQREGLTVSMPASLLLGNRETAGRGGEWFAIGDCTEGKVDKMRHLPGCPPNKGEVFNFLRRLGEEER